VPETLDFAAPTIEIGRERSGGVYRVDAEFAFARRRGPVSCARSTASSPPVSRAAADVRLVVRVAPRVRPA
jgi:hypothetical protein